MNDANKSAGWEGWMGRTLETVSTTDDISSCDMYGNNCWDSYRVLSRVLGAQVDEERGKKGERVVVQRSATYGVSKTVRLSSNRQDSTKTLTYLVTSCSELFGTVQRAWRRCSVMPSPSSPSPLRDPLSGVR